MAEQWDGREGLGRTLLTCVGSTPRPRSSRPFVEEVTIQEVSRVPNELQLTLILKHCQLHL